MKDINDLLKLGNPLLYQVCEPINKYYLPLLKEWVKDLDKAIN